MTPDEVFDAFAEIGLAVLTLADTTTRLGLSTPAHSLPYVHADSSALDLVVWTSQQEGWEAARDRLLQRVTDLGVDRLGRQELAARTVPEGFLS